MPEPSPPSKPIVHSGFAYATRFGGEFEADLQRLPIVEEFLSIIAGAYSPLVLHGEDNQAAKHAMTKFHFGPRGMEKLLTITEECTGELIKECADSGAAVDLTPKLAALTTDIATSFFLSECFSDAEKTQYADNLLQAEQVAMVGLFKANHRQPYQNERAQAQSYADRNREIVKKYVQARHEEWEREGYFAGTKPNRDVLDSVFHNDFLYDPNDVEASLEKITQWMGGMINATQVNLSSHIGGALWHVYQDPSLLESIRTETIEVGSEQQSLTDIYNQSAEIYNIALQKHFLKFCGVRGSIGESMRLGPAQDKWYSVYTGADREFEGRKYPNGALIITDLKEANCDPETWGENAGQFDPYREVYKPGEEKGPASYQALPMNYGRYHDQGNPRGCMGRMVADTIMNYVVARLFSSVQMDIQGDSDYVYTQGQTLLAQHMGEFNAVLKHRPRPGAKPA